MSLVHAAERSYRLSLSVAAAFFGLSSFIRFQALNQTPYANGWDAYFYINQIKSFLEDGQMDVPDSSLIYPLMVLVHSFADDYVLSYKLLACLLAGLFTALLFLVSLRWSQNWNVALIAACIGIFSPHLTWFAAQYPKNLFGVSLFLLTLYWIDSRQKLLLSGLLILNFFGHRSTAVLSFVALALYTSLQQLTRFIPYILILLFTLLVAGSFLPGILNLLDIERLNGLLSPQLQFAPYSFLKAFGANLVSPWWQSEIVFSVLIFFAAIATVAARLRRKENTMRLTVVVLILAFLIFPFFEWSMEGLAFRLFLIFVLLSPLALACLVLPIERPILAGSICGLLLGCSLFSYWSYVPEKHDPPYALYERIANHISMRFTKNEPSLIIAHKSLAEYIDYSTGIDAMSWVPEYDIQKENLWRIAEGVKEIQYEYYLDDNDLKLTEQLTSSYSLVREDAWNRFLESIKGEGDTEFLEALTGWKNPHSIRPAFLLKNKRD